MDKDKVYTQKEGEKKKKKEGERKRELLISHKDKGNSVIYGDINRSGGTFLK